MSSIKIHTFVPMRTIIWFLLLLPFSALGQKAVYRDTIDFGVLYKKDTMGVYVNIDNHFKTQAIVQKIKWNATSDFSQIKYKGGPFSPFEQRPISFRIKNSVGRNAQIAKTLSVITTNKIYEFYVVGVFKSKNAPKEEVRDIPELTRYTKPKKKPETLKPSTKPEKKHSETKPKELDDDLAHALGQLKNRKKADKGAGDGPRGSNTGSGEKPAPKETKKVENDPTPGVVKSPSQQVDSLIRFAGSLMGTPYVYGGMSTSGFDCSGFVKYSFNKIGVSLPRTSKTQFMEGKAVPMSQTKPGDLVFFQGTNKNGVVNHVGIVVYVDAVGVAFMHASTNTGVTISETSFQYYSERLMGFRRVL